jgi:hypothetical protein
MVALLLLDSAGLLHTVDVLSGLWGYVDRPGAVSAGVNWGCLCVLDNQSAWRKAMRVSVGL